MKLADLVAPATAEEFLDTYWPGTPYVIPADEHRARAIVDDIPRLRSGEELLSQYAAEVRLLNPAGLHAKVTTGPLALPFYRQGFTCYLPTVERQVPEIANLLDTVTAELALPRRYVVAEIFCSNSSSGVAMHADYDINFAMLVRGHKKWRLAPNESVVNPIAMCLPAGRPQRDPRQLTFPGSRPLPERMPEDSVEVEAGPGSLVFLPRGWWHETEASGECLQLNIVVKGPTWLSVLTDGLAGTMVGAPGWRAFAHGFVGDTAQRSDALREFTTLLGDLRRLLDSADDAQLARDLAEAAGYPSDGREPR